MGVKWFYSWLEDDCKNAFKTMDDTTKFNKLFIDANCILYRAVSSVRETKTELTKPLVAEVLRYLDLIVKLTNPSDLIFIAFDGPAPLSKQRSQRQNRIKEVANKDAFDTIIFTAGTEFMYDLNKRVAEFIKILMRNNDEVWGKAKVILSGPNVPGEGEHKIADYLRKLNRKDQGNCCIYSNDSDTVILSLNLNRNNIWIMKEKIYAVSIDIFPLNQEKVASIGHIMILH